MTNPRPVALVTGGAKRVGRAIIERFASRGYDIAYTWHSSSQESISLDRWLARAGRLSLSVNVDLTHPDSGVPKLIDAFKAKFDRLDVLVHNASLYEPSPLADASLEQARRLMAIHCEAPLLLTQRLAPMLRTSRGQVVTMVDLLAERPWPQYLAYCASKAALWNLTLGLARDLAPDVTVNGIAPGIVAWPDDYPEAERQKYLRRVPLARAGTPGDVAETALFLCTGGRYITGQIIRLDGGRSIT